MAEPSRAQSDDCYSRISIISRDGSEAEGTLGWREGAENRVVFQVWDGPSFAAMGDDLATAFTAARAGIMRAGFTPLAPADGSLDDSIAELFASAEEESAAAPPRFQPILWLLVAAILIALLIPAIARAEVPPIGKSQPFFTALYKWRLDATAGLSYNLMIRKESQGQLVARYDLEDLSFCEGAEDNCELDGIFVLDLPGMADEPVLVVIGHIGAHGQKLLIYRPLKDKTKPVFEATADFALGLRVRRDGVDVTVDRALAGGEARQEQLYWPAPPTGTPTATKPAVLPGITLPSPPPLTSSADAFDKDLRGIVSARDLDGFMALLSDDVLVSFGGSGGKAEFAEQWRIGTEAGRALFWQTLERLLSHGGWNEAGSRNDDEEAGYPQRLTWPWFFAAWPDDADAENVFIASNGAGLWAANDDVTPMLARLSAGTVLHGRIKEGDEWPQWVGHGTLEVVVAGGAFGVVRQEDVTPLLETRLVAVETKTGWRIEAMVAGD